MADRKALMESMNRRVVIDSREATAKRQRILVFTLIGLIVGATAAMEFLSDEGRVQHPAMVDQSLNAGTR